MQQIWVEDGHNKIKGKEFLTRKTSTEERKRKKKQDKHDKSASLED